MPALFDYYPAADRSTRQRIVTELSPSPQISSNDRAWSGVEVALHHWPGGGTVISPALEHDIVAMRTSGAARLEQRRDGKTNRRIVTAGHMTIHPKGMESSWSWDAPGAIVLLRVPPTLLHDAQASMSGQHAAGELRNCFGAHDAFIEQIAMLFLSELRSPPHPAQVLIAESLSHALAVHLVLRFNAHGSTGSGVAPGTASGLDDRTLKRVLEYMDQNVGNALSLAMLANVAAVSRFHFARLFRRSTGCSPMAYLERLRLQRAQEMIARGKLSLVEIAGVLGYADQSHFTRRFRLGVGCTPAVYASEQLHRSPR